MPPWWAVTSLPTRCTPPRYSDGASAPLSGVPEAPAPPAASARAHGSCITSLVLMLYTFLASVFWLGQIDVIALCWFLWEHALPFGALNYLLRCLPADRVRCLGSFGATEENPRRPGDEVLGLVLSARRHCYVLTVVFRRWTCLIAASVVFRTSC
jgi:hypothetical protein